jgi:CRP-like cAMP-binding protein
MISPSLKHKVGVSIFSKVLIKNKRFNDTFEHRVKEK